MRKIDLIFAILFPLNSLALNIRPEDLYDYDFGEQPCLEEVLLHIGFSLMFASLACGCIAIQEKAKKKNDIKSCLYHCIYLYIRDCL